MQYIVTAHAETEQWMDVADVEAAVGNALSDLGLLPTRVQVVVTP